MSKNNKKIFVEYLTIDAIPYENNRMRIAKNFPKYDKFKEVFLYELFYHDFLKDKIKNMLSKNFNDYQFYDSFLIELTPEEFSEIKYLFDQDSELEQTKKYDEMNRMLLFLNTSVKIAQKDTKMWEV